jgi:ATP-dependent helicase HrpB
MPSLLEIEEIIPQLKSVLETFPAVVVQAPPGSGKTTRIPIALLDASWLAGQKIVMLEPRRLAATNAARWMSRSLGEEIGKSVGYKIRFDQKVTPVTRIEVVTEGLFIRQLQNDPMLTGVGLVIFDEFHERSLDSDLSLVLCRDIQSGVRRDLRILVMSATLDAAPVLHLLGNSPFLKVEGKSFPVAIDYLRSEPKGDISQVVAISVERAICETTGDILAFLPGRGEIHRCKRFLEDGGKFNGSLHIYPLYGDLPFAEQEKALLPGNGRKVVLATNIAETSLTINGVSVVIDSGWSRQSRFDPQTGLNRLVTTRVSSASAIQRSGRAGRLGPGICYRLWTEHQHRTLIPNIPPEILTSDLAPLLLELKNWGVADPSVLSWPDPPPAAALMEASRLLQCLGALDATGRITSLGREMAELPLHPRLAKMLVIAKERGEPALACDLAALLSERDILRGTPQTGKMQERIDPEERLVYLSRWRSGDYLEDSRVEVDLYACKVVDRVSSQLLRLLGANAKRGDIKHDSSVIASLLAAAYPDRIAIRRGEGSDRYLLANGRGGKLSGRSMHTGGEFLVAMECEDKENADLVIHSAMVLSREELYRDFASSFEQKRSVRWDEEQERVVAAEEVRYGAMLLESRPFTPTAAELQTALLHGMSRSGGVTLLNWSPAARAFQARVMFLARESGEGCWPDLSDKRLDDTLEEWLPSWIDGIRTLVALKKLDVLQILRGFLDWGVARRMEEGAPAHVIVPSGSRIQLVYGAAGPPVLAVKLQELFGLSVTPCVAWGRVPVLLHLLSPAGRPIQVTQDLKSFWDKIYPEVKKELKGRYPKHPWPDDPWNAQPTRHVKKKQS